MNWTRLLLFSMLISLFACSDKKEGKSLVSVNSIHAKILSGKKLQLVDMRSEEEYHHSHIPGACNIYRSELTDFNHEIEGMRMPVDELAEFLGNKGLNSKDSIYIYDAKGNVEAARLWWMLKLYGFEKTALIDGGFIQWRMKGYTEVEGMENIQMNNFRFPGKLNKNILASKKEIAEGKYEQIIDARSMDEFDGSITKNGAFRAGHIPGAVRFDYYDMIEGGEMTFKKESKLLEMLNERGLSSEKTTVVYCHSGVRSAMALFVLKEIVGMKDVANYDGSWIEWSGDAKLDVEL